jgi:hypothetical protein
MSSEGSESQPPPGAQDVYVASPEPDLPPVPDDAGATRGHHLKSLAGHRATQIIALILVIACFAGGAAAGNMGIGAGGAALAIVLVALVVWLIANGRAHDDFFNAYANGRNLTRIDGKSTLPPVTPLLQKGDERYAEQRFNGVLPGGLDGSLCLYTYEDTSRDSDGNKQTTYVHYTIVMTQLPQTAAFMQELFCQRRFGFRFMDSAEDVFRKRKRVEHESEAVDKKFEIFMGANDDLNKARQVLSPSFLVWLENHSPDAYAFELVAGSLVCNVKGHKKSAAELDVLCTASAAVARRLAEEADEMIQTPQSVPPPQ